MGGRSGASRIWHGRRRASGRSRSAERPDGVAVKVRGDTGEPATLTAALELLATGADVRASMGEAGRELARREHDVERVADLYAAALEESVGGSAVSDAVLGEIAT